MSNIDLDVLLRKIREGFGEPNNFERIYVIFRDLENSLNFMTTIKHLFIIYYYKFIFDTNRISIAFVLIASAILPTIAIYSNLMHEHSFIELSNIGYFLSLYLCSLYTLDRLTDTSISPFTSVEKYKQLIDMLKKSHYKIYASLFKLDEDASETSEQTTDEPFCLEASRMSSQVNTTNRLNAPRVTVCNLRSNNKQRRIKAKKKKGNDRQPDGPIIILYSQNSQLRHPLDLFEKLKLLRPKK